MTSMHIMTLIAIQLSQQEGPDELPSPQVVYAIASEVLVLIWLNLISYTNLKQDPQLAQITSTLGFVLLSMMPA